MPKALEDTEFWSKLMRDVYGPREGGVIIVVDAENARKGVAKTSCAVSLADRLAHEFGYELDEADGVLSADGVLDRYRDHPGEEQPSVIVWDEAVGAGSGDARRHMTDSNVVLGRAWQVLRTRRIITLTTLPNWGDLDSRLQRLADYRLWCREWPIGQFHAYKIGTDFDGDAVTTDGLGYGRGNSTPIEYPDASSDFAGVGGPESDAHPLYAAVTTQKDRLLGTDAFDAGELRDSQAAEADGGIDPEIREQVESETKRREAIRTAIRACKPWEDADGLSYAEASRLVDYSREWVGNRVREWRDDHQHRELVADPRAANE
jgi:hypothetical protein